MDSQQINISSPGWNPGNPFISFQSFAHSIHEQAKRVLLKDKFHAEMFFFIPLDGNGHIVQWTGGDNRDATAKWVREHIREHYIYGVVHVCECWARLADGPHDHVLDQIIDGEIRVSELRPEDRVEALSVSAQSRDGYSNNWIDEIIRGKAKGAMTLGKCTSFSDFDGRFGRLFG